MKFVDAFTRFQTALILFVIYVLVIGPVSLFLRMTRGGDLLAMRKRPGELHWSPKPQVPTDSDRCERQF